MDSGTKFTDSSLIEALKSNASPDEAIRHLYRTHYSMTVAYIKRNNGTEEDAEDIFQEVIMVFIDVVKKNKFRGESSVSTFLYSLTRNIWLNELKKRGRAKYRDEKFEMGKDLVDLDVSYLIAKHELTSQLIEMVEMLGDTCKKILLAFYFEHLSIGEILGIVDYENEQVVRNKKYKCLKQMEQILAGKPGLAESFKSLL